MQAFDIEEWCNRLQICRRQAELMIARGELPAPIRIGRLRRWTGEQIDGWLTRRTEEAAHGQSIPGPGRPRGGAP
ncbi:MAG: helix-turn-helix transcriptional regulator [Acidiferrobacterales bacterium]